MPVSPLTSRARVPLVAALLLACLAFPMAEARALDCGPPLALQACQSDPAGKGCGLLYLRIDNLQEDGPVLHGLSLLPHGPATGSAPAGQCSGGGQSLPPSDAGGPDRSCIAYLVPACSYGLEARFGDGSRASADALQVHRRAPEGDTADAAPCETVTVDLGRRAVTKGAAACGAAPSAATASAAAAVVTASLPDGDVTAVTPILSAKREP